MSNKKIIITFVTKKRLQLSITLITLIILHDHYKKDLEDQKQKYLGNGIVNFRE